MMKINIKASTGSKYQVEIESTATIVNLKEAVATASEIPAAQQRLIYKGHVLKDHSTVGSYSIEDGHTVHLVRSAQPQTPTSAAPAAVPSTQGFTAPSSGMPTPGMGMGGMPNFASSPEFMNMMMNNPMVQQMMNNPDLLRSIIESNPQMQEVMERNPELRHAMQDPAILRQSMEAMRNPEMMREMMRNTDRTMSNIEAHPEGFNALRRMYQDVQAPMLDAVNPMGGSNPGTTQSQGTAAGDTQNTPLSNPWGAGASAQTSSAGAPPDLSGNPFASMFAGQGGAGAGGVNPLMGGGLGAGAQGMGAIDPNALGQMMQNPMVQQMMSSMLQNPQFVEQAMSANPQMRAAMEANPQLRSMMTSPEFMQQLSDPNTIQALLQMQGAMQRLQMSGGMNPFAFPPAPSAAAQGATGATTTGAGTTATGTGTGINAGTGGTAPQQGQMDFASMMNAMAMGGGMGGGMGGMGGMGGLGMGGGMGASPTASMTQEQLEQHYASQLQQLRDMGFYDAQTNIAALQATGGNVSAAVDRLLQQM